MSNKKKRQADGVAAAAKGGNFGFEPSLSSHHFQVVLPRGKGDYVAVTECFSWESANDLPSRTEPLDGYLRLVLPVPKWQVIADVLRADFNRRLVREGHAASRWIAGLNLIRRIWAKSLFFSRGLSKTPTQVLYQLLSAIGPGSCPKSVGGSIRKLLLRRVTPPLAGGAVGARRSASP